MNVARLFRHMLHCYAVVGRSVQVNCSRCIVYLHIQQEAVINQTFH